MKLATARRGSMERGSAKVRDEEGATLVEFALAASILFVMLFGIIAGCLALYTFNFVSDAAREATRWAVVRGGSCSALDNCGATAAEVQSYVRALGYPGMTATNLTATTNWLSASATAPTTWTSCVGSGCNVPGNAVQVQVTYTFPFDVPWWKTTSISISSKSQMVISN
jgi:Flp pilus assembly protein TadG